MKFELSNMNNIKKEITLSNELMRRCEKKARLMLNIVHSNEKFSNIKSEDAYLLGYISEIGKQFAKSNQSYEGIGAMYLKNNNYKYHNEVLRQNQISNIESDIGAVLKTANLLMNRSVEETLDQYTDSKDFMKVMNLFKYTNVLN